MQQDPPPRPAAPVPRRRVMDEMRRPNFSAGDVLGRAFGIFGRQLPVLLLLSALFHVIPTWLEIKQYERILAHVREAVESGMRVDAWELRGGSTMLVHQLASWVFPLALQAIVTYAVFRSLRGQGAGWGASIASGLGRLLHALGASLVAVLAILLMFVPILIVGAAGGPAFLLVMMIVGVVLAARMACIWYVSVQTAVVEGSGPFTALARSSKLTYGARWKVFVIVLVVYAVPVLVAAFVLNPMFEGERFVNSYVTLALLTGALQTVFAALASVAAAVAYHDLRVAKEGIHVDDLLRVFE
jgi:hypothetical protein